MSRAILGGGISGLSTAFYLSKKPHDGVALFEACDRLGGWIKTRENGSGSYFEQGARTLRNGGPAAENAFELIDEIGLLESVRPVGTGFQNRFFYMNNQLLNLPNSWKNIFLKSPLFGQPLLVPILKDIFGNQKKVEDESVYDFFSRRFGQRYADVLSGVICGIYAGNACEISVKSAMKTLFEVEQKYGSVCLGFLLHSLENLNKPKEGNPKSRPFKAWSFKKGMESLPKTLANYLIQNGVTEIHRNKKCKRIEFKNGEVLLDFNGTTHVAEHLYSCLPSNELMKLFGPEHSYLKEELSKIPFVTVAVVNLEYEGNILPVEAFGFLVPPNQKLPILGVIFDSCVYPQDDKTVLTVMLGGRWFDQYFSSNSNEEYILKTATEQVQKILKTNAVPVNHVVSILKDCIPQYLVGHQNTVDRIKKYITDKNLPMTLIGNSYSGVGITDSILSARIGVELESN